MFCARHTETRLDPTVGVCGRCFGEALEREPLGPEAPTFKSVSKFKHMAVSGKGKR